MNNNQQLLIEANNIVSGSSQQQYGDPRENFQRIANGWTTIFDVAVTPEQVALAMMWLKITRELHQHKHDNLVDIIGYTLTLNAVRNDECDNNTAG